jgi:hypothetical protein
MKGRRFNFEIAFIPEKISSKEAFLLDYGASSSFHFR